MKKAEYVASFIGHKPGKAIFVGLYRRRGDRPLYKDTYWTEPGNVELSKYVSWSYNECRESVLWFDLELLDVLGEWKGKLIINWPPPDRAWYRFACPDRNCFSVHAILDRDILSDNRMPAWRSLVLTWDELKSIPESWQSRLKEWRGVYLIFDTCSCKSYVGSAYGSENLYQRWREYAKSGHGNNKHLKGLDPSNFRFSILQRVSPDMSERNVIRLEHTWMKRLHTEYPLGLNH